MIPVAVRHLLTASCQLPAEECKTEGLTTALELEVVVEDTLLVFLALMDGLVT